MISEPILTAAQRYADAVHTLATLQIEKERTEGEIAASLIGTPNAETNKPHSRTSASEYAKSAPEVTALRYQIISAECQVITARAQYEAARVESWAKVGTPELAA